VDWNRIKTIFIIAFLVLDVFLFSQLMTKSRQFEVRNDATLEENLKSDGIVYDGLPKDVVNDHYMSANTKIFFRRRNHEDERKGGISRGSIIDSCDIGETDCGS